MLALSKRQKKSEGPRIQKMVIEVAFEFLLNVIIWKVKNPDIIQQVGSVRKEIVRVKISVSSR